MQRNESRSFRVRAFNAGYDPTARLRRDESTTQCLGAGRWRSHTAARPSTDPRFDPLLSSLPVVDGFKALGSNLLYASLGRGGMGAVYRARDLELEIDVAVKCLLPSTSAPSEVAIQRLEREAELAVSIDHPNVVQVFEAGTRGLLHFLVMEYVHGETIRQCVNRRGAIALGEALGIALRAARGLAAAHGLGLVHRDVKPDNLMIGTTGEVKVCDLGLAKIVGECTQLTGEQAVLGTPRYMAPEQWRDPRSVTATVDVYGLGATLYFMLLGEDGITATSLDAIHKSIFDEPFPDIRERRSDIPQDVAALIRRCVEKDPEDRFADCEELAAALETVATGKETSLLPAGCDVLNALDRHHAPRPDDIDELRRKVQELTLAVQWDAPGVGVRKRRSRQPAAHPIPSLVVLLLGAVLGALGAHVAPPAQPAGAPGHDVHQAAGPGGDSARQLWPGDVAPESDPGPGPKSAGAEWKCPPTDSEGLGETQERGLGG